MTVQRLRLGRVIWVAIALMALSTAHAQTPRDTLEAQPAKYQWKLDSTEGNCKSYTSEVAGKPYLAVKIMCDVPARMEVISTVLRDVPNFPAWMSDCEATKVLKVEDAANDVFVFWWHHHIPLLQDRDTLLRVNTSVHLAKGFILVDVYSTEDISYTAPDKLFRMPSAFAPFKLEWMDREHTRVSWMLDLDIGPGVPPPVANSVIRRLPFKSMAGLAKMVTDKNYLDAASKSRYAKLVNEAIQLGQLK